MKPIRPQYFSKSKHNYPEVLDRMHTILDGSVDIGGVRPDGVAIKGNINNIHIVVNDSGAANTEFVVNHNLNRIPSGFNVIRKNATCDIFDSGTTWTTTQIFLKCTAAHVKLVLEVY